MRFLVTAAVSAVRPDGVDLLVDGRHPLRITVRGERHVQVRLVPGGCSVLDRTWTFAPDGDVPWEGRHRDAPLSPRAQVPPCEVVVDAADDVRASIATARLRVEVLDDPLRLRWSHRQEGGPWRPLVHDRATGAYALGRDGSVHHYQDRPAGHRYYGLGDRTGPLERTGRRYELRSLDALGYDATSTDPLYKHVPLTITAHDGPPFAMLYDNLATSWFDLGNELDNYHAFYRRYSAASGDLDYHLVVADGLEDVTRQVVRLTGRPAFGPKWSLGYSGSTMMYTEEPNASERLLEFIERCAEHDIPCDSFQLSSGYTSIGDKRYVFTWNPDKFPDPAATAAAFAGAGMSLAANIKPCLLRDHPEYDDAAARGLFVRQAEGDDPELAIFWGDRGAHIDFTNPDAVAWWQERVTTRLLSLGIATTWNDNNEYELWDDAARCHGFGRTIPIGVARPLQGMLMVRASRKAQLAAAPGRRPHVIARSGPIGLQRYAQTWSGDNTTSWETLAANVRMGLSMSLSGMYDVGHDVGGFAGPRPDPELFVRWVQNGALHPRFTIHSWNSDFTVNEPWMHPQVTPLVREAMALRYRLLPYLYTLAWQAHVEATPMIRPLFFAFEDDPRAFHDTDDMLLGPELLVASVVRPGQRERPIYLPAGGPGWVELDTHRWHAAGQEIVLDAPLDRIPLLVRAGGALPMSTRVAHVDAAADTARELRLYPAPGGCGEVTTSGVVFEDDGVSDAWERGDCLVVRWEMTSTTDEVRLRLDAQGSYAPPWVRLRLVLPPTEERRLVVDDPTGITSVG